jgi:hypothetical protein
LDEARRSASLEIHPEESPVLDGAIAGCDCYATRALSGSDGWCSVLQCFEDIDDTFASTDFRLVTSAGSVAVGLILCSLAAYVAATPTLVAFLHTCISIGAAVAAVLALRDGQGRVSVGIHVQLENRAVRVLSVAS